MAGRSFNRLSYRNTLELEIHKDSSLWTLANQYQNYPIITQVIIENPFKTHPTYYPTIS